MTVPMTKAGVLRAMVASGRPPVLAAGVHDGLGAVLAEKAGYHAVWASSFAISAAHALPDAVLVHSKSPSPGEIEGFLAAWDHRLPIVVVPTTYYRWSAAEASAAGVSVVIHANQGLRASVTAMSEAFTTMVAEGGSASIED